MNKTVIRSSERSLPNAAADRTERNPHALKSVSRLAPTMRGLPLLGSLLDFRPRHRLAMLRRITDECGDMAQVQLGPMRSIVLSSAELVHEFLVEKADEFQKERVQSEFGRPLFGNGLLSSGEPLHQRQRKLLAPAFAPRRMAAYAETMASYTERAQQAWSDGSCMDLEHEMLALTLAIIGRTLFDADVRGSAREMGDALIDALDYMDNLASSLIPLPYAWPTPRNRKMRRAIERLDNVVYGIIAARRRSQADHGDVLSVLLSARDDSDGSGMDDRQARDEVMTLLVAGYETTTNALAWMWHLLTQHPAVYDRVQEEAQRVLGGRTPQASDLPALPYAQQVVKESMRLYPPGYLIGRNAARDVQIGPQLIRKGELVFANVYGMHHRAAYFRDPERFDPDRFSSAAEHSMVKGAYLPFGAGTRVCIGNHFAVTEAQLILATLAQRLRFEAVAQGPIEPRPSVTLRPLGGVPVRVRRIQDVAARRVAIDVEARSACPYAAATRSGRS
jgi:cytochrome P450